MQLECELIELEFVNGLGDLSLLSLLGSLSFFFPDSLVLSLLNSLCSLSGFFVGSLSGFLVLGAAVSVLGLALGATSTAVAVRLLLVLGKLAAFTSTLDGLSGLLSLGFLLLDGRSGSRSASFASFTLVVEEVLNALGLDLESHFGSEVREVGSVDVLRL